jgi:hypothetical protein
MANPGATVAGITLAALLGVGALAWQAADSAPKDRRAGVASSTSPAPAAPGAPQPSPTPTIPPVPANSGAGMRVVYSVSQNTVWLIDANEKVLRWYNVAPGTQLTPTDQYRVQRKVPGPGRGGDSLTIVNTVVFGTLQGNALGFSGTETPLADILASNAPSPSPSGSPTSTRKPTGRPSTTRPSTSGKKNPGVRETVADSKALYEFVDIGTLVAVVD